RRHPTLHSGRNPSNDNALACRSRGTIRHQCLHRRLSAISQGLRKMISRRALLKLLAASIPGACLPDLDLFGALTTQPAADRTIARGPFQPTWESLKQYGAPEWFRDAKFGIWAHWSAQCQPEEGDWYARRMYLQGDATYKFHVSNYGHPSKFGFMEIDNLWKAEHWEPEVLMDLYVKAGAKYFVA